MLGSSVLSRPVDFRPHPILVDSTRRKPANRWQKRAAVLEHAFESGWIQALVEQCLEHGLREDSPV